MPALCVLGMHRSGTSCLMGCLQNAGLFVGEVVESAPHNLKGNRENLEVRALNEAVLEFSSGSWKEPPKNLVWNTTHEVRRDEIIAVLASGGPMWGFKDPRTLLTLDFWRRAMPDVKFVGTLRHPLAVAESLRARDNMSIEQGVALWLHYNLVLLGEFEQRAFPLVNFDDDASDYAKALDRLSSDLGLHHCASTFFADSLRHHRIPDGAGLVLPIAVKAIWARLIECSRRYTLRCNDDERVP